MHTIKRIVLSGGPATGKTSLINQLAEKGYTCLPEVSREIIRAELALESDVLPWADLHAFSERVIAGRIEQYHAAKGVSFFDRSIIDSLAYMKKDGLPIPESWKSSAQNLQYFPVVFITPPWEEIFHNDNERRESWQQLLHINEYLISAYKEYDYEVVEVPKLPIEERARFILDSI